MTMGDRYQYLASTFNLFESIASSGDVCPLKCFSLQKGKNKKIIQTHDQRRANFSRPPGKCACAFPCACASCARVVIVCVCVCGVLVAPVLCCRVLVWEKGDDVPEPDKSATNPTKPTTPMCIISVYYMFRMARGQVAPLVWGSNANVSALCGRVRNGRRRCVCACSCMPVSSLPLSTIAPTWRRGQHCFA